MHQSILHHLDKGIIRITFDAEGREKWLRDMDSAIRESDHEFGIPDDLMDMPEIGWEVVDFFNIICLENPDAPLQVDDSVTISGGSKALSELRDRISALPDDKLSIDLPLTSTVNRSGSLKHLRLGGILAALPLYMVGDRFIMGELTGSDIYWLQMWWYVLIALSVFPMPWLISRRTRWGAGINAGLAAVALLATLMLVLEVFESPSYGFFIPAMVYTPILWCVASAICCAGILPLTRKRLRRATAQEERILKQVFKATSLLLGAAILFLFLVLGSLFYCIKYCYDGIERWYDYFAWFPIIAAYLLPIGILGAYLKPGRWRKACFIILGCTLIPGLLASAPSYYLALDICGDPIEFAKITLGVFPLLLAGGAIQLLRKHK
ncbi:MAG: hypothetical protein IKY91_04200 [Akkermansia sp.]|nr:hypothetical protein [Akkermansia sp.]